MSEITPVLVDECQGDLRIIQEELARYYGINNLIHELEDDNLFPKIIIGSASEDTLERVTDRHYSIERNNGTYSFSYDDYLEFEEDIAYMLPAELDSTLIARRLFIGLGVSSLAIREMWEQADVSELKREKHWQSVKTFFASPDDITETLRHVFPPELAQRVYNMEDRLSDEQALVVNGLRLQISTLLSDENMPEFIGVDQLGLVEGAQQAIRDLYDREAGAYTDIVVAGLNQSPDFGDKMFFDTLSDFILAAATPLHPDKTKHLLSPSWSRD